MKDYKIEIITICIFIAFVSFATGYFLGRRNLGDSFTIDTVISSGAESPAASVDTAPEAGASQAAAKTEVSPAQAEAASGQTAALSGDKAGDKININTADAKELESLPKIGEVLAQRIIEYRLQNGKFNSIDEIKEVKGIGDSIFSAVKDLIAV